MHKSQHTLRHTALTAILLSAPLSVLADEKTPRDPDKVEAKHELEQLERKLEQLTHPFGTLGSLHDVGQWTFVTSHTLTDGERSLDFFLYSADSDDSKDGVRTYPNSFGLCAVYRSEMTKWSIETFYSAARVGFVRLVEKEKDYIDVELTTKFIVYSDPDEPDKEIKNPNRRFMKRIRLNNGRLVVTDKPPKEEN